MIFLRDRGIGGSDRHILIVVSVLAAQCFDLQSSDPLVEKKLLESLCTPKDVGDGVVHALAARTCSARRSGVRRSRSQWSNLAVSLQAGHLNLSSLNPHIGYALICCLNLSEVAVQAGYMNLKIRGMRPRNTPE